MITGHEALESSLNHLGTIDLTESVGTALSVVYDSARSNCKSKSGELRNSILTAIEHEDNICRGICYTNVSYAAYYEFGTGPNGESNHEGTSPDIDVHYKSRGWIIPSKAMSVAEAEGYGFGVLRDSKGEVIGYKTRGQVARPFMYPALKDNEERVVDIIGKAVEELLK